MNGRQGAPGGSTGLYTGGAGAEGVDYWWVSRGGGGGSSAGSQQNGTSAFDRDGAIAPFDGGNGGDAGTTLLWFFGSNGGPGSQPGGGGGGGRDGGLGGRGADGQIRFTWTPDEDEGGGIGCDASFPDGISSYNGGQIHFGYNAQLIGSPDGQLEAGTLTKNGGSNLGTCGGADCTANNGSAQPLKLPPFPDINAPGGTNLYLGYQEARTVGANGNRFSSIGTNTEAQLTFSANQDTYYIGALNLGYNTTVFLHPGDYYLGSISINSEVDVQVLGSGTARLFVNGDVNLGSPSYFNSPGIDQAGNVSQLLVASYGNVSLNNNATLSGAVFAMGNITLGSASYVYGGATAANITLDTNSRLYFQSQGMANVDFGGVCEGSEGETYDHLRIVHPDIGLTCRASQVSILACADAACNTLYTDPVDVVMGPAGWAPSAAFSIVGGAATRAFQRSSEGSVTLDVLDAYPLPENNRVCASAGGTSSCEIEFLDTAFFLNLPELRAGVEDTFTMAALEKDTQSGQCVALFEGQTVNVGFHSNYLIPDESNLSATPRVVLNNVEIHNDESTWTQVPVSFNANGEATPTIRYDDAGELGLSALYEQAGQPDGGELTIETIAGTNVFTSTPFGFCLEATSQNWSCTEPFSECSVLAAAGDPFDLRVAAVASEPGGNDNLCVDNSITQNFRATLDIDHSLIAPSVSEDEQDEAKGDLGVSEVTFTQGDAGEVTLSQTVSEVGVFDFGIPAGQEYLTDRTLPGAELEADEGEYVGRLTPARFEVVQTTADHGTLQAGCAVTDADDIHFVDQPMFWELPPSFEINALNRQGGLTRNYTRGGFRKLDAPDVERVFPSEDEVPPLSPPTNTIKAAFDDRDGSLDIDNEGSPGVMVYNFSADDAIWYEKVPESRVPPFFPTLDFELTSVKDSDGVEDPSLPYSFTAGLAEDPETGSEFQVRYGRLAVDNVYGPENLEELLMPVRLEEWSGSSWQARDAGTCLPADLMKIADAEETTANHHTLDTSALQPGSGPGEYDLRLVPDGSQGTDTVHWSLSSGADLGSGDVPGKHDWLMDFWGRDPNPDERQSPEGIATFGVYRGHDRIIYWREVTD
ncbi:DUF6701 domain-containing protein [Marinobacter bryozoorum]|uniref:DUF6701 domain-containing protein n=1 Tax=Marinobacter bryozoorum TaxID=256324 RepID=UPI00249F4CD9|nr:DUF6701 domain-containing protein [Marinobacter bryozoorum]